MNPVIKTSWNRPLLGWQHDRALETKRWPVYQWIINRYTVLWEHLCLLLHARPIVSYRTQQCKLYLAQILWENLHAPSTNQKYSIYFDIQYGLSMCLTKHERINISNFRIHLKSVILYKLDNLVHLKYLILYINLQLLKLWNIKIDQSEIGINLTCCASIKTYFCMFWCELMIIA